MLNSNESVIINENRIFIHTLLKTFSHYFCTFFILFIISKPLHAGPNVSFIIKNVIDYYPHLAAAESMSVRMVGGKQVVFFFDTYGNQLNSEGMPISEFNRVLKNISNEVEEPRRPNMIVRNGGQIVDTRGKQTNNQPLRKPPVNQTIAQVMKTAQKAPPAKLPSNINFNQKLPGGYEILPDRDGCRDIVTNGLMEAGIEEVGTDGTCMIKYKRNITEFKMSGVDRGSAQGRVTFSNPNAQASKTNTPCNPKLNITSNPLVSSGAPIVAGTAGAVAVKALGGTDEMAMVVGGGAAITAGVTVEVVSSGMAPVIATQVYVATGVTAGALGGAVVIGGAAAAVVGAGMIVYTEHLWSGIGGEKEKYLKSWAEHTATIIYNECIQKLQNHKECMALVEKKYKEEEKRYDRDLITGNECPWYALWCRR